MEIYAKGQLSYLILNCLQERDFYGLDIITEIKDRSGGRILLKKPSVYSNLNRMEKQGQVSSYVQSSELGPNRRYYSITEKGRNTYQELKDYFDRNRIDVFKDFVMEDGPSQTIVEQEPVNEEKQSDDNDFFDFSSLEEPQTQPTKEIKEEKVDDGKFLTEEPKQEQIIEEQQVKKYSISSLLRPEQAEQEEKPAVEEIKVEEKEERVEQPTQKVLSNQEIYDISKDINRNRRRRSFADDQMAFAVSQPEEENDERAKQNLEELKSSLLASKGKTNERMSEDEFYARRTPMATPLPEKQDSYSQTSADDGVFITGQVAEQSARARKIEPPRLKIVSEKEPLPAPKKDSSIDLSHKEIISRLYSKSKGSQNGETDASQNYIYDYDDLQDYYQTQGVSFRVYEKSKAQENHNTNKLNFFTSLICFALSLISSALLFTIFYLTGNTNNVTDFLYIALPLIAGAETVYRYYAYKNYTSWEPKPLISQILIWLIAILGIGAVVGVNFIFGLAGGEFNLFCTSIFLPSIFIAIYLPIYYYIKKALYIKLWK